jgi:iron(III) transport system substrate-binding protein
MAKNAPNADNALALIEFLTSKQAQEIYADANFEYPVAPESVPNDLVKSWGDYVPDDVNLMDLAALRSQALKLIETVDFDG